MLLNDVFGLTEASARKALGSRQRLDGLLPEERQAIPTARALLAAFQGLCVNYTNHGLQLDPLTPTQRRILKLLGADVPWSEAAELALKNCGRRG
jgi:hypothetical protein